MLDEGLSFKQAWEKCEQRRPITYPNVGFQQQLTHLEELITRLKVPPGPPENFEERLRALKKMIPEGDLTKSDSQLQIGDAISKCVHENMKEAETITEKIFTQPQLLQKREIWKRIGIFFENLRRYECMPDDPELVPRASEMAKKLRSLKSVFASDLKGVSTAEAVATEAEGWAEFIAPKLKEKEEASKEEGGKGDAGSSPPTPKAGKGKKKSKDEKRSKKANKKEKKKAKKDKKSDKKEAKKDKLKEVKKQIKLAKKGAKKAKRKAAQAAKIVEKMTAHLKAGKRVREELDEDSDTDSSTDSSVSSLTSDSS